MIGVFLFGSGVVLVVLLHFVWRSRSAVRPLTTPEATTPARSLLGFALLLGELAVLLLVTGAFVLIDESGNPFWLEAFPTLLSRVMIWLTLTLTVLGWVILRLRHSNLRRAGETGIYAVLEEAVDEANNPEDGVNRVLDYISSRVDDIGDVTESSFLVFLSRRDDEVGRFAKERLEAMEG